MSDLAVIVPIRDEGARIGLHLPVLLAWCRRRGARLVLADDGSRDDGAERAAGLAAELGIDVHLLRLPRRGKGAALVCGLLSAEVPVRLFVDADLPVPTADLDRLSRAIREGADLAVGDRRSPGATREGIGAVRALVSGVASLVSRLLTGLPDSQCGCKAWSGPAAERILPHCRIDGFASDLEQILLARDARLAIRSVPVHWRDRPGSRVRLAVHLPAFVYDLLRILWQRWRFR
jgi:glycosyltransferase involved in cell wall biosynthesis